jgi:ribokinase
MAEALQGALNNPARIRQVIGMKALTVGGAMIDTIAIIGSEHIERMSMRNADTSFLLIEEGRKTESEEVSTHCGGGAINSAVAMARLGLKTATLVKLGNDARADMILSRLAEEGIAADCVKRDAQAPTGASVLVSSHERNAAVFTFRGANTHLLPADIDDGAFAVDLVYICNLSDTSADCYPHIIDKAKASGALVAVNPGIRQLAGRLGDFHDSLPKVDILAINRAEADVLVAGLVARFGESGPAPALRTVEPMPSLAARGLSGGGVNMSLPAFFGALHKLGTKCIVLTDSRAGAFVSTGNEIIFCPVVETEVQGTAGAGDAFAATFAAFIALGRPADQALMAASINAASVVGHIDTQTGLLRREAMEQQLGATPPPALRKWVA